MTTPLDIDTTLTRARHLRETGDIDAAMALVTALVEANPTHVGALRLLGSLALQNAVPAIAIDCYSRAAASTPSLDVFNELGNALLAGKQPLDAEAAFRKALALRTRDATAFRGLALAQLATDRPEEALDNFRRALAILPYDNYAAHMVAALSGEASRSAAAYVPELFDKYAETFDEHLTGTLGYRVPQLMQNLLAPHLPLGFLLDLGCGTGLVGVELHDGVPIMDGVDISRKMTDRAAARGIYRHMRTGDLVATLEHDPDLAGPYDLVTAGDVFVYLGPLEATFALVLQRLAPGGLFAFTVETITGTTPVIRASGRFAHPDAYIAALAAEHGFVLVEQHATTLRWERDQPIAGMLYLLRAG